MTTPLDPIFSPRSLVVVGASSRAESLSGRLLANVRAGGYAGAVYPINPRGGEVHGYTLLRGVTEIKGPLDLAILMVPRDAALASLDECLAAGARGIVVITAGFREGGDAGAAAERELLARARAAGVRMVGPNCMGVINTASDVALEATFSPAPPLPGSVGFASHSGALGVAVLERAREVGLGFSQFISLGNSADVTVCDVLEHWDTHEGTRAIMLYLEAIEDPTRFLAVARRVARRKPIIAAKAGRTAAGQRAASSHTGALAAADTAVAALLKQAGVLRAETLEEMFDLAVAFGGARAPVGPRVAIVSNAGGPAIVAADALAANGLVLAEFLDATKDALRTLLPPEAAVGNPVDMLPSGTPEHYRRALALALDDPGVDAVLVITVTPILVTPAEIAEAVAAVARGADKPVLTVFMCGPQFFARVPKIAGLPPVYRYPEPAVHALAGLLRYAERRARPLAAARPARSGSAAAPLAGTGDAQLDAAGAFAIVESMGIPVASYRLARTRADLETAAREIGFPVVLKAVGAALVHKSELGAVAVGLRDERELIGAMDVMSTRLAAANVAPSGYLVQKQIVGGREMILGIVRDPSVGPLVMCGTGGVGVEVWKDVSFRVAPVTPADADEMLGELRGAALLGAFRGRPAGDRPALVRALVTLGEFAAAHPDLAECDINPLLVLDAGHGCVAVDARVRVEL